MSLASDFCEACQPGSPTVTDDEIAQLEPQIPDWEMIDVRNVPRLMRTFVFPDFKSAVAFTNKVADLAEDAGHHPQIQLEWGKVAVSWWTHAIEGLHRNDFIMAAKTDQAFSDIAGTP